MTLKISIPSSTTEELRPRITVIGIGGAGGNAVNNMIESKLGDVSFLVANTDGQALTASKAPKKIQLGRSITQGLGAGAKPELGRMATEESLGEIMTEIADSHMVFITAGMGGGTGTGGAPIIAKAAREAGILTVGVVTKPFDFEGTPRMKLARQGIEALQPHVDTLIVIPNQNLFRMADDRTTLAEAFARVDAVLYQAVSGITNLIMRPGIINCDFADVKVVMRDMGKAVMGCGEASGDGRAKRAAQQAMHNPLLDDTILSGARAVLINVTGGSDMTLFEAEEAAMNVRQDVRDESTIIFGAVLDENLEGRMQVTVVATGMEADMLPFPHRQASQAPAQVATNTANGLHHNGEAMAADSSDDSLPLMPAANDEAPAGDGVEAATEALSESPTESQSATPPESPLVLKQVAQPPYKPSLWGRMVSLITGISHEDKLAIAKPSAPAKPAASAQPTSQPVATPTAKPRQKAAATTAPKPEGNGVRHPPTNSLGNGADNEAHDLATDLDVPTFLRRQVGQG